MVTLNKAQLGARRYLGNSLSPNTGQVSARGSMGYVQREQRNKLAHKVQTPYGKDEESDRRSGAARMALMRQQSQLGKDLNNRTMAAHQVNAKRPVVNNPSQVKVTSSGMLELPYNSDFAKNQMGAIGEANDQLLGLKMEGDAQGLEYARTKRDNQQGYNQLKGQTLNSNAAGGTAFSSKYGTAVANNANAFANSMGDLEAQNTAFNQNLALQRSAIQNSLNQELGLGTFDYADSLGEEAGSLGYGRAKQKIRRNKTGRQLLNTSKGKRKRKGSGKKAPAKRVQARGKSPKEAARERAARNALKRKLGQKHLTKGQRSRVKKQVN